MPRLPRWLKSTPITHTDLNAVAAAAERADNLDVDTSSGLTLKAGPAGKTLGLTPPRLATYAVVSSGGITAASGMTLGTGLIDRCYKDGNGVLQLYGGPSDPIYNSTTATAAKGDIIQAKDIDGDWAWDVASCP